MTKLIERNTTIPTRRSNTFSTASDSQPQVEINVLQGERELARDNRSIGRFILDGIPPAPRGIPQVEVTFDIDANGILAVSAKDKATNKEQSIRIEGSGGLSEADIKRMVGDAESHAAEDKERREVIEKKNQLDNLLYSTEKMLRENADKLPAEQKTELEGVIAEARKDLESDDAARIAAAHPRVEQATHKVAELLYKAQTAGSPDASSAAGSGPESPAGGAGGDVIDAEYTEEKGGPAN